MPSGGEAPSAPNWETAAFSGGKRKTLSWRESAASGGVEKKITWGAAGAPNGFKNFRWAMRIPNMCLVLKLDNGKVVSIAHTQTESQTDRQTDTQNHPIPY